MRWFKHLKIIFDSKLELLINQQLFHRYFFSIHLTQTFGLDFLEINYKVFQSLENVCLTRT